MYQNRPMTPHKFCNLYCWAWHLCPVGGIKLRPDLIEENKWTTSPTSAQLHASVPPWHSCETLPLSTDRRFATYLSCRLPIWLFIFLKLMGASIIFFALGHQKVRAGPAWKVDQERYIFISQSCMHAQRDKGTYPSIPTRVSLCHPFENVHCNAAPGN